MNLERLVLVVEDDRSILRILRDVFLKEGFAVRTAVLTVVVERMGPPGFPDL